MLLVSSSSNRIIGTITLYFHNNDATS